MMRTHTGRRLLAVIGLGLIGFAFAGCEQSPTAKQQADKAKAAAASAAKPDSKLSPAQTSQAKQEETPLKGVEKSEQPVQEPAVKSPEGEKPVAEGGAPLANDPNAGAAGSVAAQEEETPGFLPNNPPERKFPFALQATWKRLSEKEEIWIDQQQKHVIVSGRICLTKGVLEMFACPKGMKEHESVVATYPLAMYVHQALLLIGANPGRTVQWEPEYKPAEGPKIQVECWFYNEKNELVIRNAKDMVRQVSDGSPLKIDWVFGGSKFLVDPDGRELYAANGGELICVSNFSSAMIDLPIPSTAEAGGLLFEANTEMIPPLDTPVLLVLKPEFPPAAEKTGEGDSGK